MLRWFRSQIGSLGIASVMLALLAYEDRLRAPHRISIEPILAAASARDCLETLHVHSLLLMGAENMAAHQREQLALWMARFDTESCPVAQSYQIVPSRENPDVHIENWQDLPGRREHVAEVAARFRAELDAINEISRPIAIWGRVPDLLRRRGLATDGALTYLACTYPMAVSPDAAIHAAASVTGIRNVAILEAASGITEVSERLEACFTAEAERDMIERFVSAGFDRIAPADAARISPELH